MSEIVREASRALAHLDADRLEELTHSCQALNREQKQAHPAMRARIALEAVDSQRELALLSSVLDATRANLRVLHRLEALRRGRAEYAPNAGQN
ncbi:MAG: hypothetical protein P4L40_26270 [Terracidiphilus sp.]|nr:hypothetical protein [Terracidiphilus sp.]